LRLDFRDAVIYQERYISGDKSALVPLSKVLMAMFCAMSKRFFGRHRPELIRAAHDKMIEKYLSDPGYYIPKGLFFLRIKDRLLGENKPKPYQIDVDGLEIASYDKEVKLDPLVALIDYKDVILILYRANYYSPAVKKIAKIYGVRWCLDRAVELRQVFLMTRLGGVNGNNGKNSGSSGEKGSGLLDHRQGFSRPTRYDDHGMEQGTATWASKENTGQGIHV